MGEYIIQQLNILLKKNYDTLKQYRIVANKISHTDIHEFFHRKVNERYVLGNQIKEEIKKLGGKIYEAQQLEHLNINPWIIVNSKMIKNKQTSSLLEACEKAERTCKNEYDRLLRIPILPNSTRRLLKNQRDTIAGLHWNVEINSLLSQIEDNSFFDNI